MKRDSKIFIILAICLICSILTVNAKSYIGDLFQAKENLKIEEELDGTAFLAGTKVKVEKSIKGIGFIAGETITIKDKQEYIISASTKINIEANIEKDLFLFSDKVNITGNINRDTYMYATTAILDGSYGRNVYILGTDVKLKGNFEGNVTIKATNIEIEEGTKIKGTLKYNDTANIKGETKHFKIKKYQEKVNKVSFQDYLISTFVSYINILVIGLLIVYMNKKILAKTLKYPKENGIFNICIKGFIVLIGIPIIILMLLMSGTLSSVGIIGGIIFGLFIYLSNIFTSYHIANLLDNKYLKKDMNPYVLITVGLLIFKVLSIIPIIGELFILISLVYGLGIISNKIIEIKK